MAGLICDFRNRISHLQGMRAEVMPELVRGNPVRTLIEKTVHTAAMELSAIPADKQVLRLGASYLQILPDCMDDLVIDEYDPLLIAFSSHQQFPCLKSISVILMLIHSLTRRPPYARITAIA